MKKKIIAYIVIVAFVSLFMYFRQAIYYTIQERNGFYIDIGHEPIDKIVDIAYDDKEVFIISNTRAKSGGVNYHAFTRLSSDMKVEVEVNLDQLVEEHNLLEIDQLYDVLVYDDIYVLYQSTDEADEKSYVVIKLSSEGALIDSHESNDIVSHKLLIYQNQIVLLKHNGDFLSYLTLDMDLMYKGEVSLHPASSLTLKDSEIHDDDLFMLLEINGQFGLYQYNFQTMTTDIGSVDPKVKEIRIGEQLYLLEYLGDYITSVQVTNMDIDIVDEINVNPYTYYDVLIHQGRLIFYGAVTVGEQIHAVYGEYDESSIGTITLDVPYNNYFLQMISMDDAIIAVMRTNYLMDYQIRKTIYTEDDILYVID